MSGQIAQLAVIPADGGEARILTDFELGVFGEPAWSPDGSAIAVTGIEWDPEWADLEAEERKRRPRRIRRRDYRADGLGWTHDRRRFVSLIDPEGEAGARRLTGGTEHELAPAWSPDGTRVAFLSPSADRPGFTPGISVLVADLGGDVRAVAPVGQWHALGWRPDGVLHALGAPGLDFPEHASLWRFDPDPEPVIPDHDRALVAFVAGNPRLVFAGDRAYASNVDSGRVELVGIHPDGSRQELIGGNRVVTGFDAVASGTVAVTVSEVTDPGRLEIERVDGTGEVVAVGEGTGPVPIVPEHFVVAGPVADLDVWVYLPAGDGPVPLLLNIHGGPASQYGWGFFDEFQIYAGAGYGVVATNPRGSSGRSRQFLRAVMGEGWGRADTEDIEAAVAAALDRFPRLDRDRMAVMGGSYGGFLTAWLIGQQDRWRAAIVERALLSWPSFGGTSDIGGWFADAYLGEESLVWDRSPLRLADRVTTPTLIIHAEEDYRCPIEQAEQYFSALLGNGVPTEFVRFPGEGHELSRSGKPRHREERFEIVLEWLGRWLGES